MGTSQCCNWCRGQAVVSSMSSGAPHPSRGLGGARPSLAAAFSAILHILGSPKPPGDLKLSCRTLLCTQGFPRQHHAGTWAHLRGGRKCQDFSFWSGEMG